jgi:hypothetical protein
MSFPQLLIIAIVAMAGLAALRLVRVNAKRTPLPEGPGRKLFLAAFVLVPPIALGGIAAILPYVFALAIVVVLMWVGAVVVDRVATGRFGQLARVALVGGESDEAAHRDTSVTPALSQDIDLVTRANAVFPRGTGFAGQIDRSGFRDDWDRLETATKTLEAQISEDYRLGLGVAAAATTVADDARSRLDRLRKFAVDRGQTWAPTPA